MQAINRLGIDVNSCQWNNKKLSSLTVFAAWNRVALRNNKVPFVRKKLNYNSIKSCNENHRKLSYKFENSPRQFSILGQKTNNTKANPINLVKSVAPPLDFIPQN